MKKFSCKGRNVVVCTMMQSRFALFSGTLLAVLLALSAAALWYGTTIAGPSILSGSVYYVLPEELD